MPETSLIVKLDGAQAERGAKALERALGRLEKEGNQATRSMDRLKGSSDGFGKAMLALKSTIGALGIGLLARQFLSYADRWKLFEARVRGSTTGVAEFNRVSDELLRLTRDNGVALEQTVKLFQDLQRVSGELGANTTEVLELTDAVQKLGLVGGSSVEQMSNGLLQFSQGMAAGVFRAEEMNSILENMPEVAVSIAKGMSEINEDFEGGIGALRRMVLEGKLLSKDVLRALQTQFEDINERAGDIPVTMGRAMAGFNAQLTRVIGKFDEVLGLSTGVAESIQSATGALEDIDETSFDDIRGFITDIKIQFKEWELILGGIREILIAIGAIDASKTKEEIENLKQQSESWFSFLVRKAAETGQSVAFALAGPLATPAFRNLTEEALLYLTGTKEAARAAAEEMKNLAEQEAAEAKEKERAGKIAAEYARLVDEGAMSSQQFFDILDVAEKNMPLLHEAMLELAGAIGAVGKSTAKLNDEQRKLLDGFDTESKILRDFKTDLAGLQAIIEQNQGATEDEIAVRREAEQAIAALTRRYQESMDKLRDNGNETDKVTEKYEEQVQTLKDQIAATQKSGRELFIFTGLQKLDAEIVGERREEYEKLLGVLYDQQRAQEAAEQQSAAYAEAWGQALSRVDEAFVDMWKSIGKGFDEFADSLKDAFKQLLAELAHQAITRPIMLNLGASMGLNLGGSGGAISDAVSLGGNILSGGGGGGIGGGAGILGLLSGGLAGVGRLAGGGINALSSLAGSVFGVGSGADYFVQDALGRFRGGAASFGEMFGLQGNAAVGAGMLGNIAGGFAGNFLGNQIGGLFGREAESNIAGTIGGVIGSFFGGPFGTFVGSAVGGLVDSLLGGDGKKRSNIGVLQGQDLDRFDPDRLTNITTAASGLEIGAFSRRGDQGAAQEFQGTLLQIDSALTQLATALGAEIDFSQATLGGTTADAGREGPGQFFGLKGFNGVEGDIEESVANFVKAWLQEAQETFSEEFRPVVNMIIDTFGDSAESMVTAFEAAAAVQSEFDAMREMLDEVAAGAKDFGQQWDDVQELFRLANLNTFEAWEEQSKQVLRLSRDIEDAADFASLTNAIYSRYQTEIQLLGQVAEALELIDDVFQNTRENIELEQLRIQDPTRVAEYNFFRDQADALAGRLETLNDPTQILETLREIDNISRRAFSLLSDQEKLTVGDEILSFLDQVEQLAEDRLGSTLDEIEDSRNGEIGTVISNAMEDVNSTMIREIERVFGEITASQRDVAATNTANTTRFSEAVDRFSNVRTFSGRFTSSEIV